MYVRFARNLERQDMLRPSNYLYVYSSATGISVVVAVDASLETSTKVQSPFAVDSLSVMCTIY